MEKFVSDLSTWYIRRSRDRIWVNAESEDDKKSFYRTLHYVLVNLSVIMSPIMPFITDMIYTNLTGEESVHLSSWPEIKLKPDDDLIADMDIVRKIAENGHRVRKEKQLKVKQPLAGASFNLPKSFKFHATDNTEEYLKLLKAELNVKKVDMKYESPDEAVTVEYDMTLTNELKREGKLRELIRQIQDKRKQLGKKQSDTIKLTVPEEFANDLAFLKKRVLAETAAAGKELSVE